MDYIVNVPTTIKGVAKLLIINEADVSIDWNLDQSTRILNAIRLLPIHNILGLIDGSEELDVDTDKIPQFGSKESLIRVPELVVRSGQLNYGQLGLALKQDPSAKISANVKFGENHGKGASLLGLVNCKKGLFTPSSLSYGFIELGDNATKEETVIKLFFRIPIIQDLLRKAKDGKVNGFSLMGDLGETTQKRRGQCVRGIISDLYSLHNTELNDRLDNIIWEI